MFTMNRFKDRMQAGQLLAQKLLHFAQREEVVVLALPRGGVPVGYAITQVLQVPLDILLVRKLGLPGHEELAMGAIAKDGLSVLQMDVIKQLGVSLQVIETVAKRELQEIARREALYRGERPPLALQDRVVILVDDGLATGSTMQVAIQIVRQENPTRIVVAVPVGAPDVCRAIGAQADEMICLRTPHMFTSVGGWYLEFEQVSDLEVKNLLEQAGRQNTPVKSLP